MLYVSLTVGSCLYIWIKCTAVSLLRWSLMLTLMKNKQNKEALKELVYFQGRGQQLLEMLALEASCGAEVLVLCRAAPVWRRLWSKDKCIVFVFGHTWLQTKTHSSQGQWIRVGVAVLEVLGFSELMKHLQFIVIDLTKLYLCVSWCE